MTRDQQAHLHRLLSTLTQHATTAAHFLATQLQAAHEAKEHDAHEALLESMHALSRGEFQRAMNHADAAGVVVESIPHCIEARQAIDLLSASLVREQKSNDITQKIPLPSKVGKVDPELDGMLERGQAMRYRKRWQAAQLTLGKIWAMLGELAGPQIPLDELSGSDDEEIADAVAFFQRESA
jgi:hypothetical protein